MCATKIYLFLAAMIIKSTIIINNNAVKIRYCHNNMILLYHVCYFSKDKYYDVEYDVYCTHQCPVG